jgi:S1/P1 Nuclease
MRASRWMFATLVASALTGPALAWNSTGHEQIADIAWTRLTQQTKNRISAILLVAGDAPFRQVGTSSAAGRDAFRRASTFPDYIKTHSSSYNSVIPTYNNLWHPQTDPLVSPNEKVKCKSWHYYDTPIRFSGPTPGVAQSNAKVAINYAISHLAAIKNQTTSSARKKQFWWLGWIEHLTGDLHQPLHCCSSYQFSSQGDSGGNDFPLNNSSHELHAYWDAGIDHASGLVSATPPGSFFPPVTAMWSSDPALQPTAADVADLTAAHWISRGAKLADTVVYVGIQPHDVPSSSYNAAQVTLCKKQAVLAGYRLAKLLNSILG